MTAETEGKAQKVIPLGNRDAPIMWFESVPNFGLANGIANITLECGRHTLADDGSINIERSVVAYLRCNMIALELLKKAIEGIELMAQPADQTKVN